MLNFRRTVRPVEPRFQPLTAESVLEQSAAVCRAAIVFSSTWRPCYEGCECLRCHLAAEAGRLAALVADGRR